MPGENTGYLHVCVAHAPQRTVCVKIFRHTFRQKVFTKKLNRLELLEYTQANITVGTPAFRRSV